MDKRYIFGLVGAVIAGGAVGFFVGRTTMKIFLTKKFDAHIDSMTRYNIKREAADKERIEDELKRMRDVEEEAIRQVNLYEESPIEPPEGFVGLPVRTDLYTTAKAAHVDYSGRTIEQDSQDIEADVPAKKPEPYYISADQFINDHDMDYDKTTVMYYPMSSELIDDRGEPFAHPEDICPPDIDKAFGKDDADQFVAYVRNPWLESDFEVLMVEGTPNGAYD